MKGIEQRINYSTTHTNPDAGVSQFLEDVRRGLREAEAPVDSNSVGLRWFQEKGLMRPLIAHFGAEPFRALDAVYSTQTLVSSSQKSRDVLRPADVKINDDLKARFDERVEEIDTAIEETRPKLHEDFNEWEEKIFYAKSMERAYPSRVDDRRITGRGRRLKFLRETRGKAKNARRLIEVALNGQQRKETISGFTDLQTMVKTTVPLEGDICLFIRHPSDVTLLLMTLAQTIGRNRVYAVTRSGDFKNQLFQAVMKRFVDSAKLKGIEHNKKGRLRQTEYRLLNGQQSLPPDFRQAMAEFFSNKLKDASWYKKGFTLEDSHLPDEFLVYWNLFLVNIQAQEALASFEPESLGLILGDHFLNALPDDSLKIFLQLADRALALDGHFVLSEDAQEQALVEYLGFDIFSRNYNRVSPRGLHHPARWIVYQKLAQESDARETDPQNMFTYNVMDAAKKARPIGDTEKGKGLDLMNWQTLEEAYERDEVVEVICGKFTKEAGVFVTVGSVKGVIPVTALSFDLQDVPSSLEGKTLSVRILELDRDKNRLVVSEKLASRGLSRTDLAQELARLRTGEIKEARVIKATTRGLLCEIGDVSGFVHLSEISWAKVDHPRDYFKSGDLVQVKITGKDERLLQVDLSIKRLFPDPWEKIEERYLADELVIGEVVAKRPYGYLVRLENGVVGLVHASKIAGDEGIKVGQVIPAFIERVDTHSRQLSLYLVEGNPTYRSTEAKVVVETPEENILSLPEPSDIDIKEDASLERELIDTYVPVDLAAGESSSRRIDKEEFLSIEQIAKRTGATPKDIRTALKHIHGGYKLHRRKRLTGKRIGKDLFSSEEVEVIIENLEKKDN